jgi:ABC-type polar amino acid transport system ATPase subunit
VAESIVACAARGCGILLATHDRGWADSICGRVVSLVEGRIEEHP